jgi:uncharacterized protein YecE (DUF72 family)
VSARLSLGCQGWTYPDWIGVFYPAGARQEALLPFYASQFDSVELDNTFYRSPRPALVRSWARHTPPGFRFAAKVPREVTHDTALFRAGPAMTSFLKAMESLGEKLGPLLLQFPASFRRTEGSHEALARFLDSLPEGFRIAVELRSRSWQMPETAHLLRRRGVSWAWTDWRDLPAHRERTADFVYVRWLGNRSDIERYDRVQIDRTAEFDDWERELGAIRGSVTDIYGYFNNHWAGHSPASVRELLRRLGEPVGDPREAWPQSELFL